jgi:hypothetical protein
MSGRVVLIDPQNVRDTEKTPTTTRRADYRRSANLSL